MPKSILASRNEHVSALNKHLLEVLPGSINVYKSINTTCENNEAVNSPTEFLNTLRSSGVFSRILRAKDWGTNNASQEFLTNLILQWES